MRILGTCIAFAAASVAFAADGDKEKNKKLEEKIRAALEARTEGGFSEATLRSAMDYLGAYHRIKVEFDAAGLKRANIDADELKITYQAKDKLSVVLKEVLTPHKLRHVIRDGKLVITDIPPKKKAEKP